ncbi:hypothetical protein [Adhaeribacter terreus]|uniref:Lipoprotein n=1 Tax=Adhaeribacter terreus TaxID=529703 RepID=A0ABW0E5Q2_9BACT
MRFHKFLLLFLPFSLLFSCSTDSKKVETVKIDHSKTQPVPVPETPAIDPKVIEAEQYSLAPGRAGKIKVNMSSDSLKKMISAENLKAVQRELEGVPYTAFELRNPKTGDNLLLLAEESCANDKCTIFRIRVLSPKFKTEKGIRVGSTFAEVKNAYALSFVGLGETDFVAVSDANKMTFTLDITNFPPKHLDRISQDEIPDSTKVTSIMLF